MRSLVYKLTVAFLLVSLIGISLVALMAGRITAREFQTYTEARGTEIARNWLADYFDHNGSWQGLDEALDGARLLGRRGPMGRPVPRLLVAQPDGRIVTRADGYTPGDQLPTELVNQALDIEVDGEVVGLMLPGAASDAGPLPGAGPPWSAFFTRPAATDFTGRVNQLLVVAAIGAVVISLAVGALLAQTIVRPLRELQQATHAVAAGNLDLQVPVRSQDELGELAHSFNQMNAALARSRNLRRQMTADIAHDLRTPLSVISGHAEGLSDGVFPPTKETFEIIVDEAHRLSRLVEDLRTLSLAEADELSMHRQPIAPADLVHHAVVAHTPQAQHKQITLAVDVEPGLPTVHVDPDRMNQVLTNLLHNALRYTPEGGQITLAARRNREGVEIAVQDSGAGIPAADLPHVFDRFYRGDKSRQRHEGGSGLGLAIAKSIVENHGGTIRAENGSGQGARFVVMVPV